MIRRAVGRVAPASPHDGTLVKRLSATRTSWTDHGLRSGRHYAYAFFSRSSSGVFSRARKLVTWIPIGRWSSRTIDPLQGELWHVSCVASGFCAANDSTGKILTFDGRSWSDPAAAPRVGGPVSCASASFCVASSGGGFSTYDGSSWSSGQPLGNGLMGTIEDPSCAPGTTTCFAIQEGGDYPRLLRYDGTAWTVAATPNGLHDLSCPTPTYCMGLSPQGVVTYDQGTLSTTSLGANEIPWTLSCSAEADCVVLSWVQGPDDTTAVDHLRGGTWQTTTFAGQAEDVSCTSPTWCLADTINGAATYVFDGSTWTSVAPRGAYAVSLSCGNPTTCIALGTSRSISTPVRDDVYRWDGSSWTSSRPDPERGRLTDVSCPTTTFCAAVDQAGDALTYDGRTWSAPLLVEPHPFASSPRIYGRVSCPSPSFCAAFFDNGYVTTFDGSSWGPSQQIDGRDYVEPKFPSPGGVSIDCASATSCVAIDHTDVLTFDGTSWTGPTGLDRTGVDDVSCPSAQRCVAVDEGGQSLVYNGHRWSSWTRDRLGRGQYAEARISCPTTTYCLAVNGARSSVWDGVHWSRTVTVHHGPPPDLPYLAWAGVSCASPDSCTAYDNKGKVYDFDGSAWSAGVRVGVPTEPGWDATLSGMSCGAPGWCRAVSSQLAYTRGG